jgi:hypothetical protein
MKSFQKYFSTSVHIGSKLWLMLLVYFLALSCNDDEDTQSPLVIIQQPAENQPFNTIDTIFVSVTASDNERIESIDIEILDENFQPVGQRRSYTASGTSVNFATNFAVELPDLQTGFYYLTARANDGSNIGSAYRKIVLNAIPLELERIFVATASANNVKVYSRLPEASAWTQHLDRQADFAGAALSYRKNIFGLAGGEIGDAIFYETGEWQVVQSLAGPGFPGLPFFTGLSFSADVQEFLLLQSEPRLRVYDQFAAGLNGFPLQVEHRPVSAYALDQFYYVDEKPITNPNHSLAIYSRPGLLMSFLNVGGPVKGVFAKTENEVYLWVAASSGAQLRILNTTTYLVSTVFERAGESLKSVDEISPGQFVFSTSAGFFRYNFNNGSTIVISNSLSPEDVKYEALSGLIYTSSGSLLQRYSITGQLAGSETFAQPVRYFGFDYNR